MPEGKSLGTEINTDLYNNSYYAINCVTTMQIDIRKCSDDITVKSISYTSEGFQESWEEAIDWFNNHLTDENKEVD